MPDVKKLTRSFLVLAAIASLASFSLSQKYSSAPAGVAPKSPSPSPEKLLAERNAFTRNIENVPLALRPNLSGVQTNITQATAENLGDVILALNPMGPQTFGDKTGLILPTTSILTGYLTMEAPAFKIPDLWSSPENETVNAVGAGDATANQIYTKAFRGIMAATISSSSFVSALQQSMSSKADTTAVNNVVNTFSDAISQLQNLPVPEQFVPFHKNFIVFLKDQRNVIAVVALNKVDPLKSMIVLSAGTQIKQRVRDDYMAAMKEYSRLDLKQLLSNSHNNVWNAMLGFFNIPTAEAQSLLGNTPEDTCSQGMANTMGNFFTSFTNLFTTVPVSDQIVEDNTGGILAILIFDCEREILTQKAKADALTQLNAGTVASIQRTGDANFITNYEDYFGQAAVQGATKAYQNNTVDTCPQFQTDVNLAIFDPAAVLANTPQNPNGGITLTSDSVTNVNNQFGGGAGWGFGSGSSNGVPTGCQLPSQTNLSGYYTDFTSDPNAWDDYFALLTDPTNNVYGTFLGNHDTITGSAGNAQEAAQTESIANQGHRSDTECGPNAYVGPNGNTICPDQNIITPGGVWASEAQSAVNDKRAAVESANDLSNLDSEIADSLGAQLQANPQLGLYDLSYQSGNNFNNVCQYLNIPGYSNANPALNTCNSMIGKIQAQFSKYLGILNQIQNILNIFF